MKHSAFKDAWLRGEVCLHPTDTLPGLSFHPNLPGAVAKFYAVKERPEEKRPISLVAEWSVVRMIWEPLPKAWDETLRKLWPASLSVIWNASASCPQALMASDGTCALRMPEWSPDKVWMRELLLELKLPFPSSSVNTSGEPHAESWPAAVAFAAHASVPIVLPSWVPEKDETNSSVRPKASTVIKLDSDGGFAMLREGAVSRALIEKLREPVHGSQKRT